MSDEHLISMIARLNPHEGSKSAQEALRDYRSGDSTTLIERFNVPRHKLQEGQPLESVLQWMWSGGDYPMDKD
jgi:hypothetical protein